MIYHVFLGHSLLTPTDPPQTLADAVAKVRSVAAVARLAGMSPRDYTIVRGGTHIRSLTMHV